ncbi:MAG TPA: hypothetical protein VLT62_09450 [Candidatus Methylomirabilis sp.]|nr:hypothetical protein [Candidatus Methylomirabilis sp.]
MLDKFPVPYILRYALTGLLAVALLAIWPAAMFQPSLLKSLETLGGVTGLLTVGVMVGFTLDALKLYQLSPGYRKGKVRLLAGVATALSVTKEEAPYYFGKAVAMERDQGGGAIFFSHTRWVLMTISGTLFFVSFFFWLLVYVRLRWIGGEQDQALYAGVSAIACGVLALRMYFTSRQEVRSSDGAYVHFCQENRKALTQPIDQRGQHGVGRDATGEETGEPGVKPRCG